MSSLFRLKKKQFSPVSTRISDARFLGRFSFLDFEKNGQYIFQVFLEGHCDNLDHIPNSDQGQIRTEDKFGPKFSLPLYNGN